MSRWIRWFPILAAMSVLPATGCSKGTEHHAADSASTDSLPPSAPLSADRLRETDVLPHLEGAVTAGRNYVYCATFQLAWNQMQDKVLGEPMLLAGSPPMAADLARDATLSEDVLPPGSYLVKAGLAKDGVVEQIREEMQQRFPKASFALPDHTNDPWAVAYAYLQRVLKFQESFELLKRPLDFQAKTGTVKVACFGVRGFHGYSKRDKTIAGQMTVLARTDDDDFVLRLNSTSDTDEILLAKVQPEKTLAATLDAVRKRIGGHDTSSTGLGDGESLVIPVIDLNVLRRYTELEGRDLTDPKGSSLQLAIAEQGIRFRLDQTGARVESMAREEVKSEEKKGEKPRQYIFDKPFLVCLKRKSCDQPYLAMWIETPELLIR